MTIHNRKYQRIIARLRAKREQAGLTQMDVAKKMKLSQPTLNKIEVCQRRLDVMEMSDYCDAIGVSFIEVLEETICRQDSGIKIQP